MATYDLAYPGAAIDAILNTAYFLQEAGYIFQGSASEYSGTPSKRVWVIAPAGFSGLGLSSAVPQGSIGICLYNGTAWVGKVINVLTLDSAPTRNSQNGVTSGGVAATLDEIAGGIMATFASLLFDDETAAADLSTKLSYAVKFSVSDVYQTVTHLNILAATTSKAGLLSAADKVKIDSFLTNLRSLTFSDTTASADQGTQITETLKATIGGVQEVIDSITLLAATSSKAGLLSASDKAYIDALPAALTNLSNSISAALALMESLVGYYVCDTAAATAAKTVAATGYSLTNGGCIRIKMTNANTAANVTLNINSTGAKALYYDGTQASSTNTWEAGEVLEVYYDGTQYQCASGGGGKFASGEKVKDTAITNVLQDSSALIDAHAVFEAIGGLPASFNTLDLSQYPEISYYPNATYGWVVYQSYKSKIVPVPTGTKSIRITGNTNGSTNVVLLKSGTIPSSNNQPIDYADGNSFISVASGATVTVSLPANCTYLGVGTKTNVTVEPAIEYSLGSSVLQMIGQVDQNVSTLDASVTNLNEEIYGTEKSDVQPTEVKSNTSKIVEINYSGLIHNGDEIVFNGGTTYIGYVGIVNTAGTDWEVIYTNNGYVSSFDMIYNDGSNRNLRFLVKRADSGDITTTEVTNANACRLLRSSDGLLSRVEALEEEENDEITDKNGNIYEKIYGGENPAQTTKSLIPLAFSKDTDYILDWTIEGSVGTSSLFTFVLRDSSSNNVQYFLKSADIPLSGRVVITARNNAYGFGVYSSHKTTYTVYRRKYHKKVDVIFPDAVTKETKLFYTEKIKAVFLDNSYKFFSKANIKLIIDAMSSSGLNMLMFGFMGGGKGLSLQLDNMTFTADDGNVYTITPYTNSGKFLTQSDMVEIINYARNLGVDICPAINMPGHMQHLLSNQMQLAYSNSEDSLNIFSPTAISYAIGVARLFADFFSRYGCKTINCGCDEWFHYSTGYSDLYNDGYYQYADFINILTLEVSKYRMVPLIWNDAVCLYDNEFPFINREAIICYWGGVYTNARGTVAKMADVGYELINSSEDIYWVANGSQVTESAIRQFDIHKFRGNQNYTPIPRGAAFCVWIGTRENPSLDDDGDGITTSILPLITAFGETITPQFNVQQN